MGLAGACVFCVIRFFNDVTSVSRPFVGVFTSLKQFLLGAVRVLCSSGQVWPQTPAGHLLGLSDSGQSKRQDCQAHCYQKSLPQFHVFHHSPIEREFFNHINHLEKKLNFSRNNFDQICLS
jgi:hypothetical protein